DILINNPGIFKPEEFSTITRASWLQFFETNVLSGAQLTQHYLPLMIKQNWGRVIFISSESAISIPIEMVHYGMTKTAQLAISRGAAELCRGTNVTVNSVLPGPTLSDGV
ncbi:MAG TPA: SDR family oxidoreductase, partial [Candidatus Berkiella sp.]|nr:SDR family oxidoreductase [Candidatus Berkiella sp.]